jgi:hypothetical protein
VLVSATSRETTRGLIEAIATHLARRWEEAASVPATPPVYNEESDAAALGEHDPIEATTLDSLLEASGRRRRRAAPVSS